MVNFESMPQRFRVWDRVGKQFLQRRLPDGISVEYSIFELPLEIDCLDEDEKSQFVISQDTGFKDKNGKSVYTGDIVRWSVDTRREKYVYAAIVYRDGEVMYDHGSSYDGPIAGYESVTLVSEDEVVGNIWQNPELLEEKA